MNEKKAVQELVPDIRALAWVWSDRAENIFVGWFYQLAAILLFFVHRTVLLKPNSQVLTSRFPGRFRDRCHQEMVSDTAPDNPSYPACQRTCQFQKTPSLFQVMFQAVNHQLSFSIVIHHLASEYHVRTRILFKRGCLNWTLTTATYTGLTL